MTTRRRPPRATKPSAGEEALLLEARDVAAGQRWLRFEAPTLARSAQPGQFLHVMAPRHYGLLLTALPIAGFDRVNGTVSVLLTGTAAGTSALRGLRVGDTATFEGPLGRGFEIDARSRFLLLVGDAIGLGRVRACADEAVATGRQVTILLGAETVAEVLPSSLLPDEVEYVVATQDGSLGHHGGVTELIGRYEAWADQCFASGSEALIQRTMALAKGRDGRMGVARLGRRKGRRTEKRASEERRLGWLQVALPHESGCALGVCLGCVVPGADGPLRACREGPAFGAAELHPERAR